MATSRLRIVTIALAATLALSACQSREEKAEDFYRSAQALLAEGKTEQAELEFLNALRYMPQHEGARLDYAKMLLDEGRVVDGYVQYLRFVELYPDSAPIRRTLAELAVIQGTWAEAERHGREALRLDPTAPESQPIALALDYHAAVRNDQGPDRDRLYQQARALLAKGPDPLALRVTIDYLATGPDPLRAMPDIDAALALDPADYALNGLKLQLLGQQGDPDAIVAQLRQMVSLFPDDRELPVALSEYLLRQGRLDEAEALQRSAAGDPAVDVAGNIALIRFLQDRRDAAAALAQIDAAERAAGDAPAAAVYRGMRAMIRFDAGETEGAEDALAAAIDALPEKDGFRLMLQTALARMRLAEGDAEAARKTVDLVLASDRTFADALRLRAGLALADGAPQQAVVDLRSALDQDPRDVDTLLLLAQAHQEDGAPELAGEALSKAVQASGNNPDVALQYAGFLFSQGRALPAETVLQAASEANPGNLPVMTTLAKLMLRTGRLDEAQTIITNMMALPDPAAMTTARELRAALLFAQGSGEESLELLKQVAAEAGDGSQADAALIERLVAAGRYDEARTAVNAAMADRPDNPKFIAMSAAIDLLTGRSDRAEATLVALLQDRPGYAPAVRLLSDQYGATGRAAQAREVIESALKADPGSLELRGRLALRLETDGDEAGAIALYRAMLAESPGNIIVMNNLANLLARSGPEALAEAGKLAARLRDLPDPAVQDTVGWIALQQGDTAAAVMSLAVAAQGLPQDSQVQYHFARALEAAGRTAEALERYRSILFLSASANEEVVQDTLARIDALSQAAAPATSP